MKHHSDDNSTQASYKNSYHRTSYQKNALLLTLLLVIAAVGSSLWILYTMVFPLDSSTSEKGNFIADIYQNGELLQSIPLSSIEESYRLTVNGEKGAFNEIEVRPGSIGILTASCPDKLCVHQGFIDNTLLPITCLPNHLVIQLRREQTTEDALPNHKESEVPDIITY